MRDSYDMSSDLTKQEYLNEAARYRAEAERMRRRALELASAISRAALLRGAEQQEAMAKAMEKEAQSRH